MGNKKNKSRGKQKGNLVQKPSKRYSGPRQLVYNVSAPVTVGQVRNSNSSRSISNVVDPMLGAGIRVVGSELFCYICQSSSNSTGACISVTAPNSGEGYNSELAVSAFYNLNAASDLESLATPYTYYVFRSIDFEYISAISTSASAALCFAFTPDVQRESGSTGLLWPPTFASLEQYQYAMMTPVWKGATLHVRPVPHAVAGFYVDNNPASAIPYALEYQGELYGMLSCVGSGTNTNYGRIVAHYTVDLYCRGSTNSTPPGFKMSVRMSSEEKQLVKRLAELRREKALAAATTNVTDPVCQPVDICRVNGMAIQIQSTPGGGPLSGIPVDNVYAAPAVPKPLVTLGAGLECCVQENAAEPFDKVNQPQSASAGAAAASAVRRPTSSSRQ